MRIRKIIGSLILINGLLGAEVLTEDFSGATTAPLLSLLKTTQWDLFMTEFEITMDVGTCGSGIDTALGLKARSIEPIGYFETTKKRFHFPFADFDIEEGGATATSIMSDVMGDSEFSGEVSSSLDNLSGKLKKIVTFGSPRQTEEDEENEGGRDNIVWSHFIYAPVMGLIFKKKMNFLCLSGGDISLPILSEFLPAYSKDIMYVNMIPQMLMMFTPQGLTSSILDCTASVGVDSLRGFSTQERSSDNNDKTGFIDSTNGFDPNNQGNDSKPADTSGSLLDQTEGYLNALRNTMYWNVGCLGFAPIGGYISGDDPGADNELIGYSMLNLLHGASAILPKPILMKQSNFGLLGNTPKQADGSNLQLMDTMCRPKKYPSMIQSQYLFQRSGVPSTGRAHVIGVTPAITTTAANVPSGGDNWVNMVWQYRDYYAFAYFCPK